MSIASIKVSTATEAGAGNEVNGDALGFREDEGIVAVADGMGGRPGGAEASQAAIKAFMSEILLIPPSERLDEKRLQLVTLRVHGRIRELALENAKLKGLGTTLTALVFVDGRGKIVHVGDTRAYRYRDHELRQLTVDHTLVAELVARRYVDKDQAGKYPLRHVLTNVLGGEKPPRVDVFDVFLRPSDALLLLTDGFWESMGEQLIAETLNHGNELADADTLCQLLIKAANKSHPVDDRTVAVIQLSIGHKGGGR